MAKYSVHQLPVETIISWVKEKEIAIPEIQRPFVWKATKVRDLIDSLYEGYPVGYIITWRNPDVKLKNGESSQNKKVLIDGQQRITALTAAVVGHRVLDANYKETRIVISFNPTTNKFEVFNKAIEKSSQWIDDISPIISNEISISKAIRNYLQANPEADEDLIEERIEQLKKILNKQIGIIELDHSLDIDEVTEIFIRINSKGVVLSNADFVMSKIAADEEHGGNIMRKCIDYFCRLNKDRSFLKHIEDNDPKFAQHSYFSKIKWIASESDELYDPDYIDVLRASFTYKFNRGKFSDLVALLSGRNFETRSYEKDIIIESYEKLSDGIAAFVNQTNYQRFLMILQSAGFIDKKLISSHNTINFAYALYLKLRSLGYEPVIYEKMVKRWFVFSLLTGRYSGSSETYIDDDIRRINNKGIEEVLKQEESSNLGDGFWEFRLPSTLDTSSTANNAFNVYLAAQCYLQRDAFLSKDTLIRSLIDQRGDIHHIFPKKYLTNNQFNKSQYNQVANLVYTQQTINLEIKAIPPQEYMQAVLSQTNGSPVRFGTITDKFQLMENLKENDIPISVFEANESSYEDFLTERRKMMACKIKNYYESL